MPQFVPSASDVHDLGGRHKRKPSPTADPSKRESDLIAVAELMASRSPSSHISKELV